VTRSPSVMDLSSLIGMSDRIDRKGRIYVAGHRGLVGSAIVRQLRMQGFNNLIVRTHSELDLCNQAAVQNFFEKERPDYVFLAAARVGGIAANDAFRANFIQDNLQISTNVIHESYRHKVKRLLFLGSSCIYPRNCHQPMKEEYLLSGPLEITNRPYAIAKIAGIELCWAYNRQHGTKFLAAMPTNLLGPGDNYNLETSHVIPALVRKAHEAKTSGARNLVVWGTGTPQREFLYSDDAAEACIFIMDSAEQQLRPFWADPNEPPIFNVGCGEDQTIRNLAELVMEVVGFKGELRFDPSKPDGAPRKLQDISRLKSFGWTPRTGLREGIRLAYHDFVSRYGTDANAST
jgi:GDP-L-fucose synthase